MDGEGATTVLFAVKELVKNRWLILSHYLFVMRNRQRFPVIR
jgi:hypothetical protein